MKEFMKKRICDVFGLSMLAIALFLFASVITHSKNDPSITRSTSAESISNLAGSLGATISDLSLEAIGVASYILIIVFICWGILLLTKRSIPFLWLRITCLICTLPLCAGVFSWIDGGYIGEFIANKATTTTPKAILFGFSAITFAISLGIDSKVISQFFMWLVTPSAKSENSKYDAPPKSVRKKAPAKAKKKAKVAKQASFIRDTGTIFTLPSTEILRQVKATRKTYNKDQLVEDAEILEEILGDFGVKGKITDIHPGPVVTLYEFEPAPGTKSSKVIGLADDISRSMSATAARIAVIPGRNALGIELPNENREMVYFREILEHSSFEKTTAALPLALGKDIGGTPRVVDLAKMPHLLVAGTTGSGKSVAINSMIMSLLYHLSPEECKFIMIDPKMLELSAYEGIPHLITPVVTEPAKAIVALRWAVKEMENRYRSMSNLGVRNITGYNDKIKKAIKEGKKIKRTVQTGFDSNGKPVNDIVNIELEILPFLVIIVDEMADLMLVAGKDIEALIQRLAQMARAAGIHIIMATQRPSVDVITGIIKANFPTRISFQVTSKIDSRTILGEQGAEQLLGMGDMLHMAGGGRIDRIHGAFVDDRETETVVDYLKTQGEPEYISDVLEGNADDGGGAFSGTSLGFGKGGDDEIYDQAVAIVTQDRKASTSYLQRKLRIGYNKAAALVDRMEEEGVVTGANHVGKREVLAKSMDGM